MSNSEEPTEGLRSFFEQFQSLNARADGERLVEMYAPSLMVAGPAGANVITAPQLLGAISKRKQQLDDAGHRETTLVGYEETRLTPRYTLVRAEWQWIFEQGAGVPTTVKLPSTFVVDRSGDAPRILVYILDDDVGAVLRRRGEQ